ncbi:MAG: hypothetical protein ACJARR_000972 [Pseudophaeobacter arcticus]|jgi:hypothetical protein
MRLFSISTLQYLIQNRIRACQIGPQKEADLWPPIDKNQAFIRKLTKYGAVLCPAAFGDLLQMGSQKELTPTKGRGYL